MPIPKIYYHRDPQQDPPVCFCSSCSGEIYDGSEICLECRTSEDIKGCRWDQKTVRDVMEEMDYHLRGILADGLRDKVWNALAEKFLTEEERNI